MLIITGERSVGDVASDAAGAGVRRKSTRTGIGAVHGRGRTWRDGTGLRLLDGQQLKLRRRLLPYAGGGHCGLLGRRRRSHRLLGRGGDRRLSGGLLRLRRWLGFSGSGSRRRPGVALRRREDLLHLLPLLLQFPRSLSSVGGRGPVHTRLPAKGRGGRHAEAEADDGADGHAAMMQLPRWRGVVVRRAVPRTLVQTAAALISENAVSVRRTVTRRRHRRRRFPAVGRRLLLLGRAPLRRLRRRRRTGGVPLTRTTVVGRRPADQHLHQHRVLRLQQRLRAFEEDAAATQRDAQSLQSDQFVVDAQQVEQLAQAVCTPLRSRHHLHHTVRPTFLYTTAKEVMSSSPIVRLFASKRDCAKTVEPIFAKFSGKVTHGPRLDFWR